MQGESGSRSLGMLGLKEENSAPTEHGKFFKYEPNKIKKRDAIRLSIFPVSVPKGNVIALIGSPKTGKTTFCLQECFMASILGEESLYIINESPRTQFESVIHRHAKDMKLGKYELQNVTFLDFYDEECESANYDQIKAYFYGVWKTKMVYWLKQVQRPKYIVIDSFSKVGRKFVPQMYIMMETLYKCFVEACNETKKFPILFIINQKSGTSWNDADDTCSGGYGIMHQVDGKILFMRHQIDLRNMKNFRALRPGSRFYTIRFDFRELDNMPEDMVVTKEKETGKLEMKCPLSQFLEEQEAGKLQSTDGFNKPEEVFSMRLKGGADEPEE